MSFFLKRPLISINFIPVILSFYNTAVFKTSEIMNNCISSINEVNFYISRDFMSMGREACKAHVEGDTGSENGAKVSGWE